MNFLWSIASRFWHWAQQGGNSNIILIGITAWYAILTHRMMKATARQARAMLQPNIQINRFRRSQDEPGHSILIENKGTQPIVFLDVVMRCFPMGSRRIVQNQRHWDDQILPPGEHISMDYDFSKALELLDITEDRCGFQISVVVSDLSRHACAQYRFSPVLGRFSCTNGMPVRVRLRYAVRPWGWRYYRLKYWLLDKRNRD